MNVSEHPFAAGDLLVLFSDGVARAPDLAAYRQRDPQRIASQILAAHGRSHDDATCVVLRVLDARTRT